MNLPPVTLVTILSDVLASCQAAYGQTGAPAAPSRAFMTLGTPTVEGEQLTVAWSGVSTVHPFPLSQQRAIRAVAVGSVGLAVEVWRTCWPVPQVTSPTAGTLVSPDVYTAASAGLLTDAATIWGWLSRLAVEGGLCPSLPTIAGAADVALQPMVPLGPQGNLVGLRLPVSVKLSVVGQ